ncbi:helix-turn-helix domain-containing protein [Luteimonas sp. BDR2-5]|uniref:IclR family transcriptional regulator domain-containing protein n=1 Tax=Proluteimonas luteida TaxID=2878685 RepID=UPI001E59843C|nr:IclR family transcriptional regulator C-terminal domain-containing protein [Luteimonas sp. BDR2-5]MCD9028745.1 helix-turn-helix domain-containing protein [Luteimonas sp. BDR2-5]
MTAAQPHPPIAKGDHVEGLAKGLAVLECFGTERQRLNATQAAGRAGLSRAAARRHLLTLAHLGYLDTDGHAYWLSPRVLRLAGSYLASARLPRLTQPALDALAARSGLVHSVAVLDGAEVVVVARSVPALPGQRMVAHGIHLGARLPAHATSTGKVLLAALDPPALAHWLSTYAGPDGLPGLTPHTQRDPAALRAALADIAARQHCHAGAEHEPGVHALAVPLQDIHGTTVAALNAIAVGDARAAARRLDTMLPLLRDSAAALRARLA